MDVCDVILTVNVIGERAVPHYHNLLRLILPSLVVYIRPKETVPYSS